jgi:predicted phosphatase
MEEALQNKKYHVRDKKQTSGKELRLFQLLDRSLLAFCRSGMLYGSYSWGFLKNIFHIKSLDSVLSY